MKINDSSIIMMKKVKASKYLPHQSTREMRRRMKQIAAGTLQGSEVTMGARLHAIGLSSLDDIHIIKTLD